jgi:hypothetical protein
LRQLYEQLELDRFWSARLRDSSQGKQWRHILQTLVYYRLIDPGSEWRLRRLWFEQSAMGDLPGADYALVTSAQERALFCCARQNRLPRSPALPVACAIPDPAPSATVRLLSSDGRRKE